MTPELFRELAGRLRARGVWNTREAVDRQVTSPGFLALPLAGQVVLALRGERGGRE